MAENVTGESAAPPAAPAPQGAPPSAPASGTQASDTGNVPAQAAVKPDSGLLSYDDVLASQQLRDGTAPPEATEGAPPAAAVEIDTDTDAIPDDAPDWFKQRGKQIIEQRNAARAELDRHKTDAEEARRQLEQYKAWDPALEELKSLGFENAEALAKANEQKRLDAEAQERNRLLTEYEKDLDARVSIGELAEDLRNDLVAAKKQNLENQVSQRTIQAQLIESAIGTARSTHLPDMPRSVENMLRAAFNPEGIQMAARDLATYKQQIEERAVADYIAKNGKREAQPDPINVGNGAIAATADNTAGAARFNDARKFSLTEGLRERMRRLGTK